MRPCARYVWKIRPIRRGKWKGLGGVAGLQRTRKRGIFVGFIRFIMLTVVDVSLSNRMIPECL